MSPKPEDFGEEYFTTGNYAGYLERYEKYKKLVGEIDDVFGRVGLRRKDQPSFDFGCAAGHVVRALIEFGYQRVVGYDISEWAVNKGNEIAGYEVLFTNPAVITRKSYLTFIMDVFEHLDLRECREVLTLLETDLIVFRCPVALREGGDYLMKISRQDSTHITKLTRKEWMELFREYGYDFFLSLNLNTIWDSDGVMSVVFRRKDAPYPDPMA